MNEQFGKVSRLRWRPITVVIAVVMLASLAITGSASAEPKGAFAVFGDCPLTTAEACLYAKTESGAFVVGKKTVPITNPIVLQGGLRENPTTELQEFIAARDGNTLTHSPQNVPGGLTGLVNCKEIKGEGLFEKIERGSCESIFENGLTGVSATTELAGPASSILVREGNLIEGTGTALQMPLKVHLENPLLGSSCYIGSNSAPIVIAFTTGTTSPPLPNKPIKGSPGVNEFLESGEIFRISKNSLVNNSFAAPKTNGCGGLAEFLIAPIINASLGVPAAAGLNTAILNGTLEQAGAEAVKAHE